jgi:hypothetical protein
MPQVETRHREGGQGPGGTFKRWIHAVTGAPTPPGNTTARLWRHCASVLSMLERHAAQRTCPRKSTPTATQCSAGGVAAPSASARPPGQGLANCTTKPGHQSTSPGPGAPLIPCTQRSEELRCQLGSRPHRQPERCRSTPAARRPQSSSWRLVLWSRGCRHWTMCRSLSALDEFELCPPSYTFVQAGPRGRSRCPSLHDEYDRNLSFRPASSRLRGIRRIRTSPAQQQHHGAGSGFAALARRHRCGALLLPGRRRAARVVSLMARRVRQRAAFAGHSRCRVEALLWVGAQS